jgi:hypothetical protein
MKIGEIHYVLAKGFVSMKLFNAAFLRTTNGMDYIVTCTDICYSMSIGCSLLAPERVADHSTLSCAEVKNAWLYISNPPTPTPICYHGVVFY